MKDFLTANSVSLCLSSPYHTASNGEAERALRTFKEAMKVMKNEPSSFGQYRATPKLQLVTLLQKF